MADNYLEKKMDDYRGSVRRTVKRIPVRGYRSGFMELPFPPRRVLVVDGICNVGRCIVESLRNTGCKVAFTSSDRDKGKSLAESCGAQFHPADSSDARIMEHTVMSLCRAWGDLDVVICCGSDVCVEPLCAALAACRDNAPYANAYGGRIICLCRDEENASLGREVVRDLGRHGVTVHTVAVKSEDALCVARICQFVMLDSGRGIVSCVISRQ